MGNKTGKFEVTKESQDIKKETEVQEQVIIEKVEQTEAAPVTENGEIETKAEIVAVDEDKKDEVIAGEAEPKADASETNETKKKGILGWLKKLSFRKEKKTVKANDNEEKKEVEKTEKSIEKKEDETSVEKPVSEEVAKTEEAKVEEKPHLEEIKNEEAKKDEE